MATEHDKLARRIVESDGLSTTLSPIELLPLEQLLVRVTVRWPYPEMGKLEYADWMDSLKSFPLEKIQDALNRLMEAPPKRELSDGTISEYRGRPTLVDVLRTMDILAEESAAEFRKRQAEETQREWRRLEKRRAEHPEEFFGLADVLKTANVTDAKQAVKPMPERTVFQDLDLDKNAGNLDRLKAEAEKVAERYKNS